MLSLSNSKKLARLTETGIELMALDAVILVVVSRGKVELELAYP